MYKRLAWGTAVFTMMIGTGCNSNISQPPDLHTSDREFQVKATASSLPGVHKGIWRPAARYAYSETLSERINEIVHIEGAVVLLDEAHNAYVAVQSGIDFKRKYVRAPFETDPDLKIKSVGQVPSPLQIDIAEAIRQSDPATRNIYITANPQHFLRLQQLSAQSTDTPAVQNAQGGPTAEEQIRDIWQLQ